MITPHRLVRRSVCLATTLAFVFSTAHVAPVSAAGNDADAGRWAMIVLTSPTQIAVPLPAPVESAGYQAELAAVRAAQANITEEQKQSIEYWSKGGAIRWMEIMMELVARADLPPAPRPDGIYPAPDANNPFADPPFPFANPPYAARAYSYVTVAQFEEFFALLPGRADGPRSWSVSRAEIEARNYDLKATNPNAVSTQDTRTPAELLDVIVAKGREVDDALNALAALVR